MEPENADSYLVEEIRRGSETAWRQLIERFNGRLLAFVRARTASLADAEDIVQNTFIGFLQSLPNYDSSRSLETYLFTIVRYKLVDRLSAAKTAALTVESNDNDWWDRMAPEEVETPSRVAARAEDTAMQKRLLADLLKRLIHDYRDPPGF